MMGKLLYSLETIERTINLVELLGLRKDWDAGVFNDCSYEHMLPVFESAYRHFVKPLARPGELEERRRLERAIYEVFGKATVNTNGISAHARMMALVADYVTLGQQLQYPITYWSKEELFKEYETSYYWSSIWAGVSTGATGVDASKSIVEAVAKIMAAATVLRVTGAVGVVLTVAGVTAAYLTSRHFTRERDKIREEIQNRIEKNELTKKEWDVYDLLIMRRYNA